MIVTCKLFNPQDWSEALGARALAVASHCQQSEPDDPQIGWNFQSFPAGTMTPTDVIILWFRQGDYFNFRTSECAQNRTCHHYTQVSESGQSGVGTCNATPWIYTSLQGGWTAYGLSPCVCLSCSWFGHLRGSWAAG